MTQGEKDANIGQATREYAEALERISQLEIQCAKIGKEMSDLGKFLLEDPEKISIDDNGVRSRGTGGSVISDVIWAEESVKETLTELSKARQDRKQAKDKLKRLGCIGMEPDLSSTISPGLKASSDILIAPLSNAQVTSG